MGEHFARGKFCKFGQIANILDFKPHKIFTLYDVQVCVSTFTETQDFGTPSRYASSDRHAQYKTTEEGNSTSPLVSTGRLIE